MWPKAMKVDESILLTTVIEDIQELSENRSSIWNGFGRAEKTILNRR